MNGMTQDQHYVVFIRTDDAGRVVAINSSAFLTDTDGWVQIDSGRGDRYHHAQGNYLPGPLADECGVYRYKLVDGKVVERTQEEMDGDWVEPEPQPDPAERLRAVEETLAAYEDMLLMM